MCEQFLQKIKARHMLCGLFDACNVLSEEGLKSGVRAAAYALQKLRSAHSPQWAG